ncbi:MAG: hypothetical protein IKA07_05770, partial [Alistipes sp.]|nr:hypothetical protein [Alistipes sp.]
APNAPYTVDFANKKMTVDYTAATTLSNDENRDAFYKRHTFTVTGAQTETIELRRPFAQLNIGTSDYTASANAGYTPNQSFVKVTKLGDVLNLWNDKVEGTDAVITFDYAAIPTTETFPVTGYEYLAMNYLLVDSEKEVVDIEFAYKETSTGDAKTRTVGSVPVQRNYRTNIYGQLLTSDVDINVVIKPEYYEPAHELDALHKAALNGGEVTLTDDVVLTTPLEVVGKMTINLNGKTITGSWHKDNGPIIKNNGTLTIEGGTISSTGNNGGSAIQNNGVLVVEGTEIIGASVRENGGWPSYPINNYGDMTLKNVNITGYQGAVACNAAGTTVLENCNITKEYLNTSSHVFYVTDSEAKITINGGTYVHKGMDGSLAYVIAGEVTVNGGTFSAQDGGYGFAALSAGKVIINGGNINAGLLDWGGKFVVNGGVFTSKPNDNYLANGLKALLKDGKYYVVADEIDEVATTATELQAALTAGNDVVLAGDVAVANSETGSNGYGATGIDVLNGQTIDGNGNDISVNAWGTWDSAINTTGGLIKNLNVTGGMRGIFINHNSTNCSKVILENVTIDGTVYTISCDQGTNNGLEAYNSTFNGWTSYAATLGDVKFVGCSFGEGQGYAYCRPYAATEFVNCAFATGYVIENVAAVTFENCTFGGVALTAANLDQLVSNTANATIK